MFSVLFKPAEGIPGRRNSTCAGPETADACGLRGKASGLVLREQADLTCSPEPADPLGSQILS